MPSPFPGMDPYLEDPALWPAFHHQLITCLYQILLPGLVDRYKARVGQRCYSVGGAEQKEEYIEIRQRHESPIVTAVDVVTPANKTTAEGRQAYLEQRRKGREEKANLVEIDLVRQGQPLLEYSRDGLPHWDYAVTVTRASQPERYEIYTSTLQKRLPRFRMPLASDDRDTVVDLQVALTRSYDQGGFGTRVDYHQDPPVSLDEENRQFLDSQLRQHRLRDATPSHDEIARAAYALWEQDGRPHGRDQEYWHRAAEQLRRAAEATPQDG